MNTPTAAVRKSLDIYARIWPEGHLPYSGYDAAYELETLGAIHSFLTAEPGGLERSCLVGHVTGSALVVNPSFDRVLLTLHAKLGKWLQLGGHVDGNPDIAEAALREAREESGRNEVRLCHWEKHFGLETVVPAPFDIDIHEIPARKKEPSHNHYDIRYLCILDDTLPLQISNESKDLRWLTLEEARQMTTELSMQRQFHKLDAIRQRLS